MPELAEVPMRDAEVITDHSQDLSLLEQQFKIVDHERLISKFLEDDPSLCELLREAWSPLEKAFGVGKVVHLRTLTSDDENLLKVAVQLPKDFENPEGSLDAFDSDWWLRNCHRSVTALVFDYDFQDAL